MIFSLISLNVAGQTKKSTTLATTFIGWAAGNMAAPQIFQETDAPRYQKGFTVHFCLYVLFNLFLILLRVLLVRRNIVKRRDDPTIVTGKHEVSSSNDEKIEHAHAFDDLTDKENPDFRYEL
ncbi:hypothetical protein F5Y00DRAFT_268556 [Daldinia vernicosa]|uniref:uncharacterized protein n=1 Tax=Daldinia vernicosa TaxID=114800 RepID=UPI0020072841|nr:uncharacterized protein F5Y00DRAFT_268556 [Daldinia vernicosa]KAI0850447.1 hypothetical protein F5Y00DRAFT_268556 [Daldinia vernicosa]